MEFVRVSAWRNPQLRGIECYLATERLDGAIPFARAEPVVLHRVEAGDLIGPPTFVLSLDTAQQLMDDLYAAGIRPTQAEATQGHLEAMQAHIADLREIVEALLPGRTIALDYPVGKVG